MTAPIIRVNNLRVAFPSRGLMAEAVRGVDFIVENGEALGVLGESGSGKSVSALALLFALRFGIGVVLFVGSYVN